MSSSASSSLLDPAIWSHRLFTGSWQAGSHVADVRSPGNGQTLGHVGMADAAIVARQCAQAAQAQRDWASQRPDARAAVLRQAARLAEASAEAIADWIVRESGSTRAKAAVEVGASIKVLHEASALPNRAAGEVLPSEPGRLNLARRRPRGVVGVISPFNFPLVLAMRAVAPALALGNAVVLKPDPRTAVCGGVSVARLFEAAGLPAGVLQMLPGDGAAGAALVSDPHVAMIQFTGSTAAGRRVGEAAGRHLKKVSLELGGKNSLIVLDDADLELALANTAWGAYLHQGQICMATGRVLVQRPIYERFVQGLAARAAALPVGDPGSQDVALGPLIDSHQRDHVVARIRAAIDAGATLHAGGQHEGLCVSPTVLADVTPENPAFQEEIFGPVALVTPFDTDEDAVRLANQTEYGLSMAVLSADVGRALRIGEQLHTGLLHINDQTVNDEVINPFGGVGASGNGAAIGGPANLDEFTHWQWLTVKGQAPAYPF